MLNIITRRKKEAFKLQGATPLKIQQEAPAQTNVPIAVAVTAYSRMILNQYKLDALASGLELYYSDTDSLVLNGPLLESKVHTSELGLLKLEHLIAEGYFVAPKVNWIRTLEGKIVTKCKGYPGNLTLEQIMALYQGEEKRRKVGYLNNSSPSKARKGIHSKI